MGQLLVGKAEISSYFGGFHILGIVNWAERKVISFKRLVKSYEACRNFVSLFRALC